MFVLFDHGTPWGLARHLPDHQVLTARGQGWQRLTNGALLRAAELASIDVLLTTDRRIRYQQNLTGRKIAIVVLAGSTKWVHVRKQAVSIAAAVAKAAPGTYQEVAIPFD